MMSADVPSTPPPHQGPEFRTPDTRASIGGGGGYSPSITLAAGNAVKRRKARQDDASFSRPPDRLRSNNRTVHDPIPATSTSAISRGSAIHGGPTTSAAPFGRKEAPTGHHGMMSGQYGQNIVRYDNAGYWLQICYFTGMSNMILQGGFKAAGTLEATINGDLAFLGNAILYAIFAFGCLLMPPLIRWMELRSQIKFIAFLGGFGYTFYLYVNTTTPSENPGAASWVIYLIGSTMVGLGAPLVWIPTLEMVSRSAYFHVRDLSRPTSPTAAAAAAGGGGMALFNRAEDDDDDGDDEGQLQQEAHAGQQSTGRQNEILPLGGRRVERGSILSTAGGDSPNTTFYTRLDRNLSRFNGIFYGIFQLHGLVLYPLAGNSSQH
ncbi:hypothetical protein FOZ60_014540 [Perkinsus olseni]|uniref:Uncharacterized protein n=1 Tax=Perkinsus olseni TaxID=32597 RepID=A0A7J6N7J5_PEROL|nr:hypothetical protein FOZ60_014540 [Perkinsus olseni]